MRNISEMRPARMTTRLASGVLTAGLAVGLLAGTAGAAGLDPITDYSSYPAPLPAGCPDASASLLNLTFSNGRGNTTTDLRKLPLRSGDTLTMSWDGLVPGCVGLTVTLSIYATQGANFDPNTDETLLTHVSWTDGPTVLTLVVPSASADVSFLQVDAILGAPLAVIGPNGSFFNPVMRRDEGPNTLVSAKNFPAEVVEVAAPEAPAPTPPTEPAPVVPAPVEPTPAPPAPETLPEVEVEAEVLNVVPTVPTVPVEAPVTPTTAAPTTTVAVAPEVLARTATTTAPPVEVLGETVSRGSSSLPRTGVASGLLALVGTALLGAGVVAKRTGRKLQHG